LLNCARGTSKDHERGGEAGRTETDKFYLDKGVCSSPHASFGSPIDFALEGKIQKGDTSLKVD